MLLTVKIREKRSQMQLKTVCMCNFVTQLQNAEKLAIQPICMFQRSWMLELASDVVR